MVNLSFWIYFIRALRSCKSRQVEVPDGNTKVPLSGRRFKILLSWGVLIK